MRLSNPRFLNLLSAPISSILFGAWLNQLGLIGCVAILTISLGWSESRSDTSTTEPAPAIDGDQTTVISADAVLTLTCPNEWMQVKPNFEDMVINAESLNGLRMWVVSRPKEDVVNFASWAVDLHNYYASLDRSGESTDGTRFDLGGSTAIRYDITSNDGVHRWGTVEVFMQTANRCNMFIIQGPLSTFSHAKDQWAALANGLRENATALQPKHSPASQPTDVLDTLDISSDDGIFTMTLPSDWHRASTGKSGWTIASEAAGHRGIRAFSVSKEDFVGDLEAVAKSGHKTTMARMKGGLSSESNRVDLAGHPGIRYEITFDQKDYHWGMVEIYTETSSRYIQIQVEGPISLYSRQKEEWVNLVHELRENHAEPNK